MTIFKKGSSRVIRSVVIESAVANGTINLPAGAKVIGVQARNKTTTAVNLSLGNVGAGAQYFAATAVPVATSNTDITTAGLLSELTLSFAVSKVASQVFYTLSATPPLPGVDIVIQYVELLESLTPVQLQNPPAY